MACRNSVCPYNDSVRANGCTLFAGESWIACRGASVRPVPAKQTTQKTKEKNNG